MKPAPEHIDFLDHLRGVAILSVFIFHCLLYAFGIFHPPWSGWFRDPNIGASNLLVFPAFFGSVGVAIFFAISGFCIHLSHERSRIKGFKVYFIRRFFRIYPPYLLALCFVALFNVAVHQDSVSEEIYQFFPHFFLVHNFREDFAYKMNGAFWSLGVEVQLYLLYPLLLWFASKFGWLRTLWIPAVFELGLRTIEAVVSTAPASPDLPRFLTGSPFYFWFSWAIGAALADAYLKGEPLPFRNFLGFVWPVAFIASYFFKPIYPYNFTLASLTTTYLMSALLTRPAINFVPGGLMKYVLEHLRRAGIVSYSAYLIHIPLLSRVPHYISLILPHHHPSRLVMYAFCLAAWFPIFGLSYLMYRYVEQPSIAWGKRIIERTCRPSSSTIPLATDPAS